MVDDVDTFSRYEAVYQRVPASSDGTAVPGSTLLNSIYSSLGAWMGSHSVQQATALPEDSTDSHLDERVQSIIQALEDMGTRALQAAALNVCLPANGWLKSATAARSSSSCDSLSPAAQHPMQPPVNTCSRRSVECDLAVGSPGRDTRKLSGQQDGHKTVSSSAITSQQVSHKKATASAAAALKSTATNTVSGTADVVAAVTAENKQLHLELTCCRASLAALYLMCSRLRQENQHLSRVSDCCSEELLSDALEQLLGEKNLLQQEVMRLRQQNSALQELLEYTAPAAAPSASGPSAAWVPVSGYASSGSNLAALTAAAVEADDGDVSSVLTGCGHTSSDPGLSTSVSLVQQEDYVLHQQRQQRCGHQLHCHPQASDVFRSNSPICSESGSVAGDAAEGCTGAWLEHAEVAVEATISGSPRQLDSGVMTSTGVSTDVALEQHLGLPGQPRGSCGDLAVASGSLALETQIDAHGEMPWSQHQQGGEAAAATEQQLAAAVAKATQSCRQVGRQQQLRRGAAGNKVAPAIDHDVQDSLGQVKGQLLPRCTACTSK